MHLPDMWAGLFGYGFASRKVLGAEPLRSSRDGVHVATAITESADP